MKPFRFRPYRFARPIVRVPLIYPRNTGQPLAEYVAAFNALNFLKG